MASELELVLFQFCKTYILLTKVNFLSLNKIRNQYTLITVALEKAVPYILNK